MENIGKRFGDRTVIGLADPWIYIYKNYNRTLRLKRYLCKCKCGDVSKVLFSYLQIGRSLRCKKCSRAFKRLSVGSKFNSFTIIKCLGTKERGGQSSFVYLCRCECGALSEKGHSVLCETRPLSCDKCYVKKISKIKTKNSGDVVREGDVFGWWTVVEAFYKNEGADMSKGKSLCVCKCGTTREINHHALKRFLTTRCKKCFKNTQKDPV